MRWGRAWLLACSALAWSAQAAAQRNETAPASAPATDLVSATAPASASATPAPSSWYGWQILASDGAALAVGLAIGGASDDEGHRRFGDVVASAWGLGMIGSLSVHAAHESSGYGLAGLGYRSLAPPVVSVLGLGLGCLFTRVADNCASDGARFGFAFGALATSALDIGLLSYERRSSETRHWYGWQTLVIDAASFSAGVIVTLRRDEPDRRKRWGGLAGLPYLTGFLISPWVHAFHGRWGTALGSLALRALGPGLGTLVGMSGYCAASGGADRCAGDGAIYGLLGGTLLVAAIDIGLMSHEKADIERAQGNGAAIAPFVTSVEGGFRAGIAGSL